MQEYTKAPSIQRFPDKEAALASLDYRGIAYVLMEESGCTRGATCVISRECGYTRENR